ncbi:type II toxin-antitoxin system RelE/ParE family toxin [Sulfuriroseicoccus oceanibius]|uniref:Uncharacterized protein n=1 Tax=Sulfuriroseicoccus oceanibius TaxID=2707525 RepID=A0A6B3LCB9_9BACT|nr:type II toxin-antitoxin system RelE/ParE family toxin [Sulfuriroseicoccus oceanibius]QQL44456.1 hypothetical protein G3M56_011250 [Sulfuriroseicoccus oceanibius]
MKALVISKGAVQDIRDGSSFYDALDLGLGEYFTSTMIAEIEGLRITGGTHRKAYADYHRLLVRKFPYAVYYTSEDDRIIVWAVVDCRRNPDWIRDHLKQL